MQFEPALAVVAGSSQLGEFIAPRDLADPLVGQRESLGPLQRQTGASAVERYREGFALRQEEERLVRRRYFVIAWIRNGLRAHLQMRDC